MIDIDHLRSWIGREETASEQLTAAAVQRFAATFDMATEREGGVAGGDVPGGIAPTMIHLCLTQPVAPTAGLGPDGHPARGGFLPPVPLPRRMWAGGAFDFTGDIRVGELVTRRSIIRDVTLKEGRSGALCFVTVSHEITSDGRPVVTERQDIVYRGDAVPPVARSLAQGAADGAGPGAVRGNAAARPTMPEGATRGAEVEPGVPPASRQAGFPQTAAVDARAPNVPPVSAQHASTPRDPALTSGQPAIPVPPGPPPGAAAALPGEHRVVITPSPALLFRYSALTFNGHRIHYDAPYVREVEGYPGLIVHGPMQATLLVQLAERIAGRRPARFTFRSLSPLFDDGDLALNAATDADGLRLWTAYAAGGPVAMEARASW